MIALLDCQWSEQLGRYDLDRSNLPAGAEEIASWLSDDVVSTSGAKWWIEKLSSLVLSGREGGYIGTGNAHHVMFAKGMVFIECEYVENLKVLIEVNSIIQCLQDYLVFLVEAVRGHGFPPEPLLVEYEMEGQPAMEFYMSSGFPLGLQPDDMKN